MIGIDARAAAEERGGRGTMVRELLRALAAREDGHRYELWTREPWDEPLGQRMRWRTVALPDPWWHVRVGLTAGRTCDGFLSTNSYLTTWFLQVPSVAVVCDLVAFDPEHRPQRRAGLVERATLPLAVRRADRFLAISQATADDLAARFPRAAARTRVALLAADDRYRPEADGGDDAVLARHGLHEPYVLGVGTLEPRKNLPRLIEAFTALGDAGHQLVLVGALGWDAGETLAAVRRHEGRVLTLGHVPDADLPALYRRADLFAYPSLYEGFGLPVLEAMASGTATLTSCTSSLPEVAGDAAVYVDPRDVGSIREGLARVLADPALRQRLGRAGAARARRFSWQRFADEAVAAVTEAAQR